MQTAEKVCGAEQDAPRSGAPALAAPLLDNECGNVPTVAPRPAWSRKQWVTRRAVIDRLRYWQSHGYQCLWVTLTSSPTSPDKRLRADFQVLRKRIGRELGYFAFEYLCVDTREGHGVLHMIWSWKGANKRKKASFYIPFVWLQEQWTEIHGAFHVNVKRMGTADKDARRLSRYIVAQYCGDQNALVRLSQSKMAVPLTRMRGALLRTLRDLPERQAMFVHFWVPGTPMEKMPEVGKLWRAYFWLVFRSAWGELVQIGRCHAFGVHLVWWCDELQRV